MRVVCNSLEEFFEDLQTQTALSGPECVYQKTVRVSISTKRIEQRAQQSVLLQVSAVVGCDQGEYLLMLGMDCGVDYLDAEEDCQGSELAIQRRSHVRQQALSLGLVVGPGVIDV